MIFVELTPFVAFREEYWTDEDLRAMRPASGARCGRCDTRWCRASKLRWSAQGRGKRGGARVIYYWHVPGDRIYLIYGYVKSRSEDLTARQLKVLRELMKDIDDG